MQELVLLGASGYTGRLVARELDRLGMPFVAAGRSPDRVRDAVAGLDHATDVAVVDVTDAEGLRSLLADARVLVTTVGPFARLGRDVLDAAIATGTHYVDSTGEEPFVRWAVDERDEAAATAGVVAVSAAGYDYVPGDLLAELAVRSLDAPRAVHVSYLVKGPGALPGPFSAGTRATAAEMIGAPVVAWSARARVEEPFASARRLAWFPKPVGPHHAAGYPGAEPLWLPRRHPGLETVRTYLALPTVVAELAQLASSAARWEPAAAVARRVLRAGGGDPSPERRAQQRWACVAEAADAHGTLARAWAYGKDLYGLTGRCLAWYAQRLLDAGADVVPGVRSPAEAVADPGAALDALADATGLRWSIRRSADPG